MKYRNYTIFIVTVIIFSVIFSGCGRQTESNLSLSQKADNQPTIMPTDIPEEVTSSPQITQPESVSTPSADASTSATESMITIKTKNGNIVIKLYDKVAPNTVKNFLSKINSKFYDGLTFHRVIAGFMAQGGDPLGNGTGGGQIASEINDLPFKKGSVGLARGGNKAISNDSQFFMCYDDFGCQHLTGDYVNFGEVTSGFDALNKVVQGDKMITISVNK